MTEPLPAAFSSTVYHEKSTRKVQNAARAADAPDGSSRGRPALGPGRTGHGLGPSHLGRPLRRLGPPRPRQPPAAQQRARTAHIGGHPRRGRACGAGQGAASEPWPPAPQDHALTRPAAPRTTPGYAGPVQACAAGAHKYGVSARTLRAMTAMCVAPAAQASTWPAYAGASRGAAGRLMA